MPVRRRTLAACALAAAAISAIAVPVSSGAPQGASKTSTVAVADDYFTPTALKIKQGSKVNWVWSDGNLDTHNVVLTNDHPKKVKRGDFRSSSGAIGLAFKRKFKVPGTYGFICTYHRSVMRMSLKVKRR